MFCFFMLYKNFMDLLYVSIKFLMNLIVTCFLFIKVLLVFFETEFALGADQIFEIFKVQWNIGYHWSKCVI